MDPHYTSHLAPHRKFCRNESADKPHLTLKMTHSSDSTIPVHKQPFRNFLGVVTSGMLGRVLALGPHGADRVVFLIHVIFTFLYIISHLISHSHINGLEGSMLGA